MLHRAPRVEAAHREYYPYYGSDDLGLYHDGHFYLDTTGNGKWDGVAGGDTHHTFGISSIRSTALPIIGDWDGNGADDLGLFNDSRFYLDTTRNGAWDGVAGGDTFYFFDCCITGVPISGNWGLPSASGE